MPPKRRYPPTKLHTLAGKKTTSFTLQRQSTYCVFPKIEIRRPPFRTLLMNEGGTR
jgi:hypothetical protein